MMGEAFTVLAVLEAVDKMSAPMEKISAVLDGFSETTVKAAEAATEAGAKIDEALLRTASGADAVEIADARLSVAQSRLTQATEEQAAAEKALLDVQAKAAAGEEDAVAATDQLAAASDALTAAQKRTAAASKAVADAERLQADTARAAAAATTTSAAETDVAAGAQSRLGTAAEETSGKSGLMSKAMGVGALAIAAIGYESVKAAGNWQSLTEHLVTDAGESQKNLAMVSAGMLKLAADTGTSTTDVANGMYHVESAGYHGAQALQVMKAAAEGAKVGGADLDTVSKALTGTMNAYSMSGSQATSMMNQLVTAVGQGDMKMQDLASSLGNVAPVAAAAHISFAQVAGAIATMTAQNMSAQQATQDLAHTIGSLQNPQAVQIKQMQALGLNSNQVSNSLGKVGLTGTLEELTQAVAKNTSGGQVLINTFNSSKQAAANAQTMIQAMPASLQSVAKAYLAGSITSKQWTADLQAMPPVQAAMMKQFAGVADQTQKFNQLLTSGSPAAETYNAAMSKMLGGTTGLKTALMLTGGRAATFQAAVDAVGKAATHTGANVDNWGAIQATFNQKLDRAKASVEAAGISIGQMLLPAVSAIAGVIANVVGPTASWIAQHEKIIGLVLAFVGPAVAVVGVIKTITMVQKAWTAAQLLFNAAMDANPIGLVIAAIAALVGGAIYAYTHFQTFRNVVNTVFKAVKSVVVDAWHVLQAVWSGLVTAVEWVGHVFSDVFDAVSGVVKDIWSVISGVWNTISSVTTTVWNAISGFFQKWWPLLLAIFAAPIALLVAAWNHFHKQIEDTAKTVWNAISGFFVGAWHVIESAAQTAWNLIMRWIVTPMQQAWAELSSIFHTVMGFLSGVWNSILGVVTGAWTAVKNAIVKPLQDAWNWLTGFVGQFLSIGENIINGIIQGVENAAGSLFSSLEGVAQGALNAAKNFLGINSPSKLFADHVGLGIVEGIAKGVNDNAHLAHKALTGLSAGLTTSAHATITSSLSATSGLSALGAGAGVGAGPLVVNINMARGVITNQAGMKQLAIEVGKELTTEFHRAGYKVKVF